MRGSLGRSGYVWLAARLRRPDAKGIGLSSRLKISLGYNTPPSSRDFLIWRETDSRRSGYA